METFMWWEENIVKILKLVGLFEVIKEDEQKNEIIKMWLKKSE